MNRLFSRKRWHFLLLAAVLAAGAAALAMRQLPTDAPPALNLMLQQMRDDPARWTRSEGDASMLIVDLRKNAIVGAAMAPAGIFVSTKDGRDYFVADQSGRFSGLLVDAYRRDGTDAFPFAVLDKDAARDWRGDLGLLLIFGLIGVMAFQGYRASGGHFKFARGQSAVTFGDVVGAGEAKAALKDIMAYLKDAKGFTALGARPPKGVLLSGPPGTGKTQLARALAGECKVNFIAATGGDFTAMFLGLGSMRVKALFRKARKHAPCIVFLDEVDGIGRRSNTENGGPAEAEGNRIINQILAEIDGFEASAGVIVIGATNFPDAVDPALLREGRFDRKIAVKLPHVADREALFRLYAGRLRTGGEIDFAQLARLTTGLAPAAIAYAVNHAALIAARNDQTEVAMAHLLEAIEVCRMGEVTGAADALTEAERERIAVHEAGHAVVAEVLGVGRVEKVTILPRGQALGVTLVTQKEDKQLHLKSELENRIQMLLAGRAAELVTYNDASSGAASDLKEASRIALSMVATLGLGDRGTLFSLDALQSLGMKPDTASAVAEAERVLATQNERCLATLAAFGVALRQIIDRLLADETIDGEEVARAVAAVRAEAAPPPYTIATPAALFGPAAASGTPAPLAR